MARTLADIVAHFGGELKGDGARVVTGLATLEAATPGQLSFLANPKYRSQLAATRAGAVILAAETLAACPGDAIVTPQPYLYFARVSQWLAAGQAPAPGIHPSAVVEAPLPPSVSVGAHCWIGADVDIGENSVLYPGVRIYPGCRIGRRAIVHSGAVIGADGFGFAREADGSWVKIPQIGRVLIGNDVEIGANTTVDRGALEDTVIGDGVKLDNLIQIAHNVRIGDHTAMAACSGVAGSTTIGKRCMIGGSANIMGHIDIVDDVVVSAVSFATKSIPEKGVYTGSVPSMEHKEWTRNYSRLRHLDSMADRIKALEQQLATLQGNKED